MNFLKALFQKREKSWIYAGLIWSGAFGCLVAALNFRDAENDDDSRED